MTRRVSVATAVLIRRDPSDVFAFFADLRNEPEWNLGHVRNVTKTSPGPIGLGTTFEGDHPGFGPATWQLCEYDEPHHLVIEGTVGGAPYRYSGDFEPRPDGTLLRSRIEWEPRGWWAALGPLLPIILRLQACRSFRNLRTAIER
jgi:polyketide cyclase/dehydrase/lipid transport protein